MLQLFVSTIFCVNFLLYAVACDTQVTLGYLEITFATKII